MRFIDIDLDSKSLKKYKYFFVFVFAFSSVMLFFYITHFGKIYPNVYVAGEKLGGKTVEEAQEILRLKVSNLGRNGIVLEVGDKDVSLDLMRSGIEINVEESVGAAMTFGREGTFVDKLLFAIKSYFVHKDLPAEYSVNASMFADALDSELSQFDENAQDASIVFEGGAPKVRESKDGSVVDRTKLISDIKAKIASLDGTTTKVEFVEDKPKVNDANAQQALDRVQDLTTQRITLKFDQDTWVYSGVKLFDLLEFHPSRYQGENLAYLSIGDNPVKIVQIYPADEALLYLDLTLDSDKLDSALSAIALRVDKPKKDADIRFEGGRVIEFSAAQDGQKLDKLLLEQLFGDKVSIGNTNSNREIVIALPVAVDKAKIANEEINNLGITELVGRGISYFAGSIPNRVHNLSLGSSRINGAIVKPGEVFSFNRTVGEVSGATGYKQAYVISAGRTVLDDGGGICQVSTTVFRAALNSGLPIVSRTAHAYRVGYYEQGGFKPGLDATVWSPSVDLQFKNDTKNHLLVQAVVDRANSKLQVDIYGTGDGRKVELGTPVVSGEIPAPEDRYQDDPTLQKGTVKQVDFAAKGATSIFSRKVTTDGEVLIDEQFKSRYRPWQAVFLVGTAE